MGKTADSFTNEYKDSAYPPETTNPDIKATKDYGRKYAKAFYAEWYCGGARIFYDYRAKIFSNRQYCAGSQDAGQYDKWIQGSTDKSYLNINRQIFSIMPKIMDSVFNILSKYDPKIEVDAIDSVSMDEKMQAYMEKVVNIKYAQHFEDINQAAGFPAVAPPNPRDPKQIEELDLHQDVFFKLDSEISMEEAQSLVMDTNNWPEIKKQLDKDLVEAGFGCVSNYCLKNGFITLKREEPERLMFRFTKKPDFSDVKCFGVVDEMLLSDIRMLAGDEFTETEYREIAMVHSSYANNQTPNVYQTSMDLNHWNIPVEKFEFKTVNRLVKKTRVDKSGNEWLEDKPHDWTPSEKNKDNKVNVEYEIYYSGYWVVGTDYIFGYGPSSNIPRDPTNLYKAYPKYVVYSSHMTNGFIHAMAERVHVACDAIQLAHLKVETLKANVAPMGVSIDWPALMGVMAGLGGAVMEPLALLDHWRQTGVLLYDGSMIKNGRDPIRELLIDISGQMMAFYKDIDNNVQYIRSMLGLNPLTDGSMPAADQPVQTSKMATNSSVGTLYPVYSAIKYIKLMTYKAITARIQSVAEQGKGYKGYVKALGDNNMKLIEINDKCTMAEYGFIIEEVPNEEEEAQFRNDLAMALKQALISFDDYLMIQRVSNRKLAERLIGIKTRQRQEEQQKSKMMDITATAEQQAKSTQATAQAEVWKESQLHVFRMEEINAKGAWSVRGQEVAHAGAMEQLKESRAADLVLAEHKHFNDLDQKNAESANTMNEQQQEAELQPEPAAVQ